MAKGRACRRTALALGLLVSGALACSDDSVTPWPDSGADAAPLADQAPAQDQGPGAEASTGQDKGPGHDQGALDQGALDQGAPDACVPSTFSHPFTSNPSSASASVAVLKPGKGFSAQGWNSNNSGMVLYTASAPITTGYVEVQMAGFTNTSLAAQSLKFHIISGWQVNKSLPQSKWQLRLSPSNIYKITACEVATGSAWGECKDAYLKSVIKISSSTAYHTYKFAWNKQSFSFYLDGKLISKAAFTFKKSMSVKYIYLGNDISPAVSMHKEDIYIKNVKIVSSNGCP